MNEAVQIILRSVVAFFTLLIFTRILGKQQVSQLTFFDYVIGITVGSIAADIIDFNKNLGLQLLGLASWMSLAFILQFVTLKSRMLSKLIDGDPVLVVRNGKILENNMAKMRYKTKELLEQLRLKGAFDLADVEFAILETNGNLSVLKKSQQLPVTPNDLNIPTEYKGLSTALILEGEVIQKNLERCKLNRNWLFNELNKQGITDIKEVFIGTLDSSGNLYVDKYKNAP